MRNDERVFTVMTKLGKVLKALLFGAIGISLGYAVWFTLSSMVALPVLPVQIPEVVSNWPIAGNLFPMTETDNGPVQAVINLTTWAFGSIGAIIGFMLGARR